jgi:hypothetical protein
LFRALSRINRRAQDWRVGHLVLTPLRVCGCQCHRKCGRPAAALAPDDGRQQSVLTCHANPPTNRGDGHFVLKCQDRARARPWFSSIRVFDLVEADRERCVVVARQARPARRAVRRGVEP